MNVTYRELKPDIVIVICIMGAQYKCLSYSYSYSLLISSLDRKGRVGLERHMDVTTTLTGLQGCQNRLALLLGQMS